MKKDGFFVISEITTVDKYHDYEIYPNSCLDIIPVPYYNFNPHFEHLPYPADLYKSKFRDLVYS